MTNQNPYDILEQRGFIADCTHPKEVRELLGKEKTTFYIGFDPSADSMHVGHFLTLMAASHLQKTGHRPITLVGGGTGMVGDPTGREEMRKIMTKESINNNITSIKNQFSRFIDYNNDNALIINNADWLLGLEYLPFLRDIGVHFSVNKMLSADSNKSRFEQGLSFLEFNYMILQGYDFLELFKRHNCVLQLGGSDQWSNILSGVELIRRKESKEAYGLTLSLLLTSDGRKMGKTADGALWLDKNKTSPYDFYQYFRNIDDPSVIPTLKRLTFLELDEIEKLNKLTGKDINEAKEILAYEVTKIVHGEEEAIASKKAAKSLFETNSDDGAIPTCTILKVDYPSGIDIISLLEKSGLVKSRSEARRTIEQGGIQINKTKIHDINYIVTEKDILLQKGKKNFCKIIISDGSID